MCFIFTATLAEWNVAIYGTKDSPESKNRAAISPPPSAAPSTTAAATAASVQPKVMETPLPVKPVSNGWLDNTKAPLHHNNLEQQDRTSFLPNLEPVPVLSSSGSSGGGAAGCRPGHWDSAAAVCLSTCLALVIASLS